MSLLVEARGLAKDYDLDGQVVHALRGATLAIHTGDRVSIMGPSGCGKSTLLHLLGAMDVPTSGHLVLLGRDAARLSDAERTALRLHHFGFVFQGFFLLPMLTAAENVSLPLLEAGVGKAERERRLQEVFETVGLAHRARHKPGQLSGGEAWWSTSPTSITRCAPSSTASTTATGTTCSPTRRSRTSASCFTTGCESVWASRCPCASSRDTGKWAEL